jgi:hypothetical protein
LKRSFNFSSPFAVDANADRLSFSVVWDNPLIANASKIPRARNLVFNNIANQIVISKLTKVYDITQTCYKKM